MKDFKFKATGRKLKNNYEKKYSNIEQKLSFIVGHSERFEEFMRTLEQMKEKVYQEI